jgi:hypothetical protein
VSVIDPIGPRPVDPAHRQLAPPAVRERYLDDSERNRERRRPRKRREQPEQPADDREDPPEHVDVRV